MSEDYIHRVRDELRIDLLRAAHELAAARVALTMRRFERELKYRPDQARIARGQQGGGQFADEGQGTAKKKKLLAAGKIARRFLPAALANPEAAAAAGTAALGPLAAGVGVSRTAGLAAVIADGGGQDVGSLHMTPFLHIPAALDTRAQSAQDYQTAYEQGKINEDCEEQHLKDEADCRTYAAIYAKKGRYARNQILKICMDQAFLRKIQCERSGGSENITIPLFTGR